MVLQVSAHTGQMLDDGDAIPLKFGLITDTRLHQHLGCVDGTERQHHLAGSTDSVQRSVVRELHSGRPMAVESHPRHQRAGENGYVRPIQEGKT
jgi:hypothetical protein